MSLNSSSAYRRPYGADFGRVLVGMQAPRQDKRAFQKFHAHCGNGEAKFWLDPAIELAKNYGLSAVQVREIERIIEGHYDERKAAWNTHFGS